MAGEFIENSINERGDMLIREINARMILRAKMETTTFKLGGSQISTQTKKEKLKMRRNMKMKMKLPRKTSEEGGG